MRVHNRKDRIVLTAIHYALPLLTAALPVVFLPGLARGQCYTVVSVAGAQAMIESDEAVIVVDVRELSEYCAEQPTPPLPPGHIPGALNYPLNSGVLEQRYTELPIDGDIIIICRSGSRGARAAEFLCSRGFSAVYNVNGGMLAWTGETVLCIDSDGDSVFDDLDICPDVFNPSQADSDGDGIGDSCESLFLRGDANADKLVEISDAILVLGVLFTGRESPACEDGADANDDGTVDISDSIRILLHLFIGDAPLPQPVGECGPDPSEDSLRCVSSASCE